MEHISFDSSRRLCLLCFFIVAAWMLEAECDSRFCEITGSWFLDWNLLESTSGMLKSFEADTSVNDCLTVGFSSFGFWTSARFFKGRSSPTACTNISSLDLIWVWERILIQDWRFALAWTYVLAMTLSYFEILDHKRSLEVRRSMSLEMKVESFAWSGKFFTRNLCWSSR